MGLTEDCSCMFGVDVKIICKYNPRVYGYVEQSEDIEGIVKTHIKIYIGDYWYGNVLQYGLINRMFKDKKQAFYCLRHQSLHIVDIARACLGLPM